MELENLEFKNFKPRDGVEDSSKEYVEKTLKKTGLEGSARVVVSERNRTFFFSIVGIVQNKLFTNDLSFQKDRLHGWPRDWQYGAISKLVYQFILNLRSQGIKSQEKNDNPSK